MRLAPVHPVTHQRRRGFAVLVLLAVGALVAAGCGSSSNKSSGSPATTAPSATTAPPATTPTTTAGGTSSGSTAAKIQNFAFQPATITVKAGQKVTWSNDDTTTHTVTADGGSFDSGDLSPGKSFSFTFAKAGTFKYHCSIHSFMHGTVKVS